MHLKNSKDMQNSNQGLSSYVRGVSINQDTSLKGGNLTGYTFMQNLRLKVQNT